MNENDPSTKATEPKPNPEPIESEVASPEQGAEGVIEQLEAELAAARKSGAENYERYLRSVADLENFRKRAIREKDDLRQYAASRVLEDLIPVLDSLSLGLTAAKAPNADIQAVVGPARSRMLDAPHAQATQGVTPSTRGRMKQAHSDCDPA